MKEKKERQVLTDADGEGEQWIIRKGKVVKGKKKRGKNGIIRSKLKCIYTNADSLLNERLESLLLIVEHKPDIICISEVVPKNVFMPVEEIESMVEIVECYDLLFNSIKYKLRH